MVIYGAKLVRKLFVATKAKNVFQVKNAWAFFGPLQLALAFRLATFVLIPYLLRARFFTLKSGFF